jgi:hypothetical protein
VDIGVFLIECILGEFKNLTDKAIAKTETVCQKLQLHKNDARLNRKPHSFYKPPFFHLYSALLCTKYTSIFPATVPCFSHLRVRLVGVTLYSLCQPASYPKHCSLLQMIFEEGGGERKDDQD